MTQPRTYTAKDVAAELGVSIGTARRLLSKHGVPRGPGAPYQLTQDQFDKVISKVRPKLLLSKFGPELDKLLKSLEPNDEDNLRGSLRKAKAIAKGSEGVDIYAQERGSGSYYTIKAALDLAVAVWKAEKRAEGLWKADHQRPPGAAAVAHQLAKAVWDAEKRRRKSGG